MGLRWLANNQIFHRESYPSPTNKGKILQIELVSVTMKCFPKQISQKKSLQKQKEPIIKTGKKTLHKSTLKRRNKNFKEKSNNCKENLKKLNREAFINKTRRNIKINKD